MNRYATKKKGKTEVFPFWNMQDITGIINWFKDKEDWDGYLITMFGLLLGRRIGDTISMKWSDLYYENGKRKNEITTIEEQKTGKITLIPISPVVFDSIEIYKEKTKIDPINNIDSFIFNVPSKTAWVNRRNDNIYKCNNLDMWCQYFNKDFSEKRKEKIRKDFQKQNIYNSIGDFLYYEVEWMDIVKWQVDGYRKRFTQAAKDIDIQYSVSCHSLRKTFGYITKMIHPYDVNCMETLQDIFNHSDIQTTMHYIGLSEEKKRQYFNDMGEVVKKLEDGDQNIMINNSPIVSLKCEDLRNILIEAIGDREYAINVLNECLNKVDELKIKSL